MNATNTDGQKESSLIQVRKIRNLIIKEFLLFRQLNVIHSYNYKKEISVAFFQGKFSVFPSDLRKDLITTSYYELNTPTDVAWIIFNLEKKSKL